MSTQRQGYFCIDHRASPGISAEEARALGCMAVPEGTMLEAATLKCAHCGRHSIRNPERVRARGHCRKCDRYICDDAACHRECQPFAKAAEHLKEQAFRREAGYSPLPKLPFILLK